MSYQHTNWWDRPFYPSYAYPTVGDSAVVDTDVPEVANDDDEVIDVVPDEVTTDTTGEGNTGDDTDVDTSSTSTIKTPLITGLLPDQFAAYLASLGLGPGPSGGNGDNGDTGESEFDFKEWLLDSSLLDPVPNWVLLAGGGVVVYALVRGK